MKDNLKISSGYFGKHHSYLLPQDNYYTRKISNKLKETLSLTPQHSVLEIGCGAGRFSIPLLDQGIRMTCVDPAAELIDVFKAHLKPSHKAEIITDDLFSLSGKYDFVIGFFVLHHFKGQQDLFGKLKGLLKQGGSIGFIEPNPFNPLYYLAPLFYEGITYKDEYYSMVIKRKLMENLNLCGFRNVGVEKFGFLPPQIINRGFGPSLDKLTEKCFPRLCQIITATLER